MCARIATKNIDYLIMRFSRCSFLFFTQRLILYKSYTLKFRQNLYHFFQIYFEVSSRPYTKFYIKLNIITAFNRIYIIKNHKQLIEFITRFRLYKILITLFSLYNTLAIFQNYINYILYDALDNYYTVYLNNIFIFFKT